MGMFMFISLEFVIPSRNFMEILHENREECRGFHVTFQSFTFSMMVMLLFCLLVYCIPCSSLPSQCHYIFILCTSVLLTLTSSSPCLVVLSSQSSSVTSSSSSSTSPPPS
uniref:Uncharacterized protein n=1 Tax=Cacopsylla melanoneura TaxID=428564 RepID=A0A8D8R346_9HEMI